MDDTRGTKNAEIPLGTEARLAEPVEKTKLHRVFAARFWRK